MKDINELIAKLKIEISKGDRETAFSAALQEIEQFYKENFFLGSYEVAIFLANQEKTVLSFACPKYLVNAGMIPISSTDAIISSIFRTGRGVVANNLQQQKHLSVFEIIRTPEGELKPIWKMMAALIAVDEDKIGAIEISRRASKPEDADEDFTENDLLFLQKTIKILAPFIKKVMPENFRSTVK